MYVGGGWPVYGQPLLRLLQTMKRFVPWAGLMLAATLGTSIAAEDFKGWGRPDPAVWSLPAALDPATPALVEIVVPGFAAVPVPEGLVLRVAGQDASVQPGGPDLPMLVKLLPGVPGYKARLRVLDSASEDIASVSVAPATGWAVADPESPKPKLLPRRTRDASIYASPGFWPAEPLRLDEAWMGTQKWIRIEFRPIQYDATTRTVRFFRDMKAQIELEREEVVQP